MPTGPLAFFAERHRLASDLLRLREEAGLSTRALAERVGISQSKVSKVENAKLGISPAEVVVWAQALGASAEQISRLVERASKAQVETVSWRSAMREGLPGLQEEVADLEAVSATIRSFHPVLVPGLLQTADYARLVYDEGRPPDRQDIPAAVAARIERQTILYDQSHHFDFVVTEVALRWRIGPPRVYLAQLDRILSVATLPNVDVGLLPLQVELPAWHSHGINMFEDRTDGGDPLVHVETLTAGFNVSKGDGVEEYREAFARLRRACVRDSVARDLITIIAAELASSA